ncbi:hypothetical protein H4R35_000296 [Dimargaris xerosporica]|nr:hypothetical protein H4R35_000296 [Dimargaris xerosporica]
MAARLHWLWTCATIWWLAACIVRAELIMADGGVVMRAYDLPHTLDEDDHSHDLEGYLLGLDYAPNCVLSINQTRYKDFFSDHDNSTHSHNLFAFVDMAKAMQFGCRNVLHTLECPYPTDTYTGLAGDSMPKIAAIVFTANLGSTMDFGAPDDLTYNFYREAPVGDMELLLVGIDDGMRLTELVNKGLETSSQGLAVVYKHDIGPWNRMQRAGYYQFIHWLFFIINLLIAIYAAYHVTLTIYQSRFRHRFRIASHTTMFIFAVLFLIGPLDNNDDRHEFILNGLAWPFLASTFYLVLSRWARVVQSVYRWRYMWLFRWFLRIVMAIIALEAIFYIFAFAKVSTTTPLPRVAFLFIVYIAPPINMTQDLAVYAIGTYVIRHQCRFNKAEEGSKALVKLTVVCLISITGCLSSSIIFIVKGATWPTRHVGGYVAYVVLLNISSVLIASAMLWNLSVASMVGFDSSNRATETGRSTTLRNELQSGVPPMAMEHGNLYRISSEHTSGVQEKPSPLHRKESIELGAVSYPSNHYQAHQYVDPIPWDPESTYSNYVPGDRKLLD